MASFGVIPLSLCATLFVIGQSSLGYAQEQEDCIQQASAGVHATAWEGIRDYFASLNPTTAGSNPKDRLYDLREQIVQLETQKARLIRLLEDHLRGSVSLHLASADLSLSAIPAVVDQIDLITQKLNMISDDHDPFFTTTVYKNLLLSLQVKRAITLCTLSAQVASQTPDRRLMSSLVKDLKDELKEISEADDALGNYIRTTPA